MLQTDAVTYGVDQVVHPGHVLVVGARQASQAQGRALDGDRRMAAR